MSELRNAWTPQQVQDGIGEANESLPEARTTDRYPVPGRASGVDVREGADVQEPGAAEAGTSGTTLQVPADSPRGTADEGGL